MTKKRPLTEIIAASWRHLVSSRQCVLGLQDYMQTLSDEAFLAHHGIYLKPRDWRINQQFEGAWQLTEYYEPGTVTENAENGPWAIVSDDRDDLVQLGLNAVFENYQTIEA